MRKVIVFLLLLLLVPMFVMYSNQPQALWSRNCSLIGVFDNYVVCHSNENIVLLDITSGENIREIKGRNPYLIGEFLSFVRGNTLYNLNLRSDEIKEIQTNLTRIYAGFDFGNYTLFIQITNKSLVPSIIYHICHRDECFSALIQNGSIPQVLKVDNKMILGSTIGREVFYVEKGKIIFNFTSDFPVRTFEIAGNKVFIADGGEALGDIYSGKLYAFNKDGTLLWEYSLTPEDRAFACLYANNNGLYGITYNARMLILSFDGKLEKIVESPLTNKVMLNAESISIGCNQGAFAYVVNTYGGKRESGFCVYSDEGFRCYKAKLLSTKIFIRREYIVVQLVDGKVAVFKVS